jgi:AAA ATPase domain
MCSGVVDVTAMVSEPSPQARGKAAPRLRPAGDEVMRGREAEQKIVRDLLRRVQRGRGGVVLVEGEPGLGKSLLLRESASQAAGQRFSLAAGAADQLGRPIPFFALRGALPQPFATVAAHGQHDLPDATGWWISQMQVHLEQRAAANPVLVCLDDLQWAGPATLAALRTLARELRWQPVAWLLARCSASGQDTERLFSLLEEDGAVRVSLGPLGEDAVACLLAEAFGALPDQSLLALASGAAGNPSLLAELVRGLADDDSVEVTGGRAVLASARLPERMRRLAQRRLDGLSERARHLLVTAAVLGTSSWPPPPPAPPRPSPPATPATRPWPPLPRTASAWPTRTWPAWPRPPRSIPILGLKPRQPKTWASCTPGRRTASRRSATSPRPSAGTSESARPPTPPASGADSAGSAFGAATGHQRPAGP